MKRHYAEESGFTFVEVLIGLVVMSLVVAAVLAGAAMSSRSVILADERTTAESLARSQMEYVKVQSYQVAPAGGVASYEVIASIPADYAIWSAGRGGAEAAGVVGVPTSESGAELVNDDGLQSVNLVIKHDGVTVWTMQNWKGQR